LRIESSEMSIKGRVAITGRPGVGKTTLCEHVIERLPLAAGGMITKEIRKCGHRVGFAVIDVATGEEGVLAHVHHRDGPQVGRYTVDVRSLETVGVAAIRRAIEVSDLVVIDEIGPMELRCPAFAPAVEAALASGKSLIVSTHANADHPIAHRVRRELTLFRIKLGNRDGLVDEIVAAFYGASRGASGR
jgi:nucleoside-triphosphatase